MGCSLLKYKHCYITGDVMKRKISITYLNCKVGSFIRKRRVMMKISGRSLGLMVHMSQQQISRYERGITSFTIPQLDFFFTALNISWDEFIYDVIMDMDTKVLNS